jgi:sigma-B regulation protein RsbU (phosphoserine phosphatase)
MSGSEHSATPDLSVPAVALPSADSPPLPRAREAEDLRLPVRTRQAAHALTAAAALLAVLGLLGWVTGVAPLRGRLLELPGMKANTAVCLLLLSGALWLVRDRRVERDVVRTVLPVLLAGASGLVTLATLVEWVSGASLGIDQLLVADPDGFAYPGRMSPQTAGSLLVLSGTVAAAVALGCGHRLVQAGALVTLVVGTAALVGLAFGVSTFFGVSSVIGTGVPTAVALLCLGAALLLRAPERGAVALLLAPGPGGRLARLLIPLSVAFPLVVGVTLFRMRRADAVAEDVAWSVFVLAGILLPAAVILWTAGLLERVDRRRAGAHAARLAAERARATTLVEERRRLAASEARARALIEHAPEAIVVLDVASGRFVRVNREAERLFGMPRADLLAVGPVDVSPPVQPDGRPSSESAREWVGEAVRGGTPAFEWEHRTASGEPVLCEVRLLRLPDEDRVLVRGSLTDIGVRRRGERERQRLEAQRLAAEARSEAERAARAEAEEAQARLSLLARASALLAEATDEEELVASLADLLAATYADWCSVLLPDEQNRLNRWAVRAADPALAGLAAALEHHPLVDAGDDDPRVWAWRSGRPRRVDHIVGPGFFAAVQDPELAARLREVPVAAGLAVPMVARGERLGVLSMLRHGDKPPFSPADEQMLADLGRRAGVALDSLRVLAARTRVAARLQETLLPSQLPVIPGVELAARYLAAEKAAEVGGDFYDAFPLSRDDYALVIGDVAGRGVDAAGLTGLARSTLRALGSDLSPAAALARLNDVLVARVGNERFLTAAYLRLRPVVDGADLTVAVAGHPLPLVLRGDGEVEPVGEPGTLLGVLGEVSVAERAVRLSPGDSLFLYTDGVIEAHGDAGLYGESRLVELLADAAGQSADVVAARVEQAILAYRTGGADDLAVLVLRLRPPFVSGEQLLVDVSLAAELGATRRARQVLEAATRELLPDDRRYDVSVAVSELVVNAVAQLTGAPAASLRPHPVHLRAVRRHGTLRVEVTNPGPGFLLADSLPGPEAEAGRGLAVVRALTTRLGVEAGQGTTRVWFEVPVPDGQPDRSVGSALPPQSTTATRSPRRGT